MNMFRVQLFTIVRSPKHELLGRMDQAPDNEGGNRVQRTEGGPCQLQALSST